MANDLEMRAAFEAWAGTMNKLMPLSFKRDEDGQYFAYFTEFSWRLWQAALSRTEATGGEQAVSDARDAERYRWLRQRNSVLDSVPIFTARRVTSEDGRFSHNDLLANEEMDAAIDLAMNPNCEGDPGECGFNGACMYACGASRKGA